jgi:hypothetical protein
MKFSFFPLALLLALTVASCEDDLVDNLTDDPTISGDTSHIVPPRYLSLSALTQWFEDEYSISFITQFDEEDYLVISEGMPMTCTFATDTTRIKRLLYYIGDNVLNIFPARVVAKYMPPTIYIVDSLKSPFSFTDDLSNPAKPDRRSWFIPITGQTTSDYLVIGNAGPRFDDKKEGLREELISLFVDRLLYNTTLPDIEAFQKITEDATTAAGASWVTVSGNVVFWSGNNYPYWDGRMHDILIGEASSGSTWVNYYNADDTPWLGRGIRKMGRAGYVGFSNRNLFGIAYKSFSYMKATVKQDFGDFVAFVVTTPPAEREAFYAQVDADKTCALGGLSDDERSGEKPIPDHLFQIPPDTTWYDGRFPYAGTLGANAMREKDAYVKAYFKANLNINLE